MKPLPLIKLLTLALALAALGPTAARAQDPSQADHIMVVQLISNGPMPSHYRLVRKLL
jgi:hypothetical protein